MSTILSSEINLRGTCDLDFGSILRRSISAPIVARTLKIANSGRALLVGVYFLANSMSCEAGGQLTPTEGLPVLPKK